MTQTLRVGSRSPFITAAAVAAIVLMVFAAPVVATWGDSVSEALARLLPLWRAWILPTAQWWSAGVAVLVGATLTGSIGLLMRLEWARRLFVAALALWFCLALAGSWLNQEVIGVVVQQSLSHTALPAAVAGTVDGLGVALRVLAAVVNLGLCALLVWTMAKLGSRPIRQEFA
jgi:hypothetical protein